MKDRGFFSKMTHFYDNEFHADKYDKQMKKGYKAATEKTRVLKANPIISSPRFIYIVWGAVFTGLFLLGVLAFVGFGRLISFLGGTPKGAPWWLYLVWFAVSAGLSLKLTYNIRVSFRDENVGQHGTSRFTTMEEIKQQYKEVSDEPDGTPIPGYGGLPIACYKGKMYIDDTNTNNYILGITRSGKGEMFSIRMIDTCSRAEKPCSFVILDMKYDIIRMTKKTLEERGYKTYVFNFEHPLDGDDYNPLTEVVKFYKGNADERGYATTLCNSIAHTYFAGKEGGSDSDNSEYFLENAKASFTAAALAHTDDCLKEDIRTNAENASKWILAQAVYSETLAESKEHPENLDEIRKANTAYRMVKDQSTTEIVDTCDMIPLNEKFKMMNECEKKINIPSIIHMYQELAAEFINDKDNKLDIYFSNRPQYDPAKAQYSSIRSTGDRTKGSIVSQAIIKLNLYQDFGPFASMASQSTIDLREIGFGDQPVAVYIESPYYDHSKDALPINLITQIYQVNQREAANRQDPKCSRRIIMHLDEIASFPQIPNLATQLSVGLGINVCHNLFLQNDKQLDDRYGADAAETIRGNCGNTVFIQSNSDDTVERFSKKLGSKTQLEVSRSGSRLSLNKTISESYIEVPLMDERQLRDLMPGECVINRSMYRTDLNRESVKPHPIANLQEEGRSFRYRYEYLTKYFPNAETVPMSSTQRNVIRLLKPQEMFFDYRIALNAQTYGQAYMYLLKNPKPIEPTKKEDEPEDEYNAKKTAYSSKLKTYLQNVECYKALKDHFKYDDPLTDFSRQDRQKIYSANIGISDEDSRGSAMIKLIQSDLTLKQKYNMRKVLEQGGPKWA